MKSKIKKVQQITTQDNRLLLRLANEQRIVKAATRTTMIVPISLSSISQAETAEKTCKQAHSKLVRGGKTAEEAVTRLGGKTLPAAIMEVLDIR